MNWKTKTIDLGEVSSNSETTFTFENDVPIDNIYSLRPSCGCIVSRVKGNTITGTFKPGSFPKHLDSKIKDYQKTIFINILYDDLETKEILTVTSKITR